MKKKIILTLIAAVTVICNATAQNTEAKAILDKTVAAFNKAGGITAQFSLANSQGGKEQGRVTGTMDLKGSKFKVSTPTTTTWFDGKTQWSYVMDNEEVNISTPTKAEIANMNPYSYINMYKNGFTYSLGTTKTLRGHSTSEVVLTATDKKKSAQKVIITVDKQTYEPLCIRVKQGKTWSVISIKSFSKGKKFPDSHFKFNKNEHPKAEIIDLR